MTPRPMGLRSWSDAEPIESADLREQPACGHEEILRRFILHGSAIFVSGPDVWASLRVCQQASRPGQGAVVGHDRIRHLVQASGGRMLSSWIKPRRDQPYRAIPDPGRNRDQTGSTIPAIPSTRKYCLIAEFTSIHRPSSVYWMCGEDGIQKHRYDSNCR